MVVLMVEMAVNTMIKYGNGGCGGSKCNYNDFCEAMINFLLTGHDCNDNNRRKKVMMMLVVVTVSTKIPILEMVVVFMIVKMMIEVIVFKSRY